MDNFSGTQQPEGKDNGAAPVSSLIYMKKISQALRIQELEEENELLKSEILQRHMASAESAKNVADRDKVAETRRIAEWEKEKCDTAQIVAGLTAKINSMCDIFNEDYLKFNEMAERLKFLEENYEPCVKRSLAKAKLVRKELKEKEETYEAHVKELKKTINKLEQEIKEKQSSQKEFKEKISQLEQEVKEKTDKIAEVSNKHIFELPPPKRGLITRSPSYYNGDDDLSSFTSCCDEAFEARAIKYCGKRTQFSMDKALTYRHLRKTRTSIRITDSDSINSEKRQRAETLKGPT